MPKVRRLGRVVEIVIRLVFGTAALLAAALRSSAVSHAVNVSFLERQHLIDRHRDARRRRKTSCFSKCWEAHEAATYFTLYSHNFCWPVRTPRTRSPDRTLAAAHSGDGGGADRSCLVTRRVDKVPGHQA